MGWILKGREMLVVDRYLLGVGGGGWRVEGGGRVRGLRDSGEGGK